METFSSLLDICMGNSPVTGEFPTQRPVTRSFDVFFDLRLEKRLSKQSWGWWFETLSRPARRHYNVPKYSTLSVSRLHCYNERHNKDDIAYMCWRYMVVFCKFMFYFSIAVRYIVLYLSGLGSIVVTFVLCEILCYIGWRCIKKLQHLSLC